MLTAIAALVFSSTLSVQQPPAAVKPDPREKLDTAIAEGVRLLEKKDYVAFLTAFVTPADLAARGKSVEDFAAEFATERGEVALVALKQIQTLKPAMSADGTSATFQLHLADERAPGAMTWTKIGARWYISK